MKKAIFTIGHSTRTLEEFIEILKEHEITLVIDVRTIPYSKYNPQFNQDTLKEALLKSSIKYYHLKKLGGLRKPKKDSINLGWKNLSFRGFADYMQSEEFYSGLNELIKLSKSEKVRVVIMCAEFLPWRCHRSLISDYLVTIKNILVIHIINKSNTQKHELTSFAKVKRDEVMYPERLK